MARPINDGFKSIEYKICNKCEKLNTKQKYSKQMF